MRRSRSGVLAPLLRRGLGRQSGGILGRLLPSRQLRGAAARAGQAVEIVVSYLPQVDDAPDPGEVVWAWVPYEDDPQRGKDRPVLVIGHRDGTLCGLMLSSQDHDADAADEARHGRYWMDIGSGEWDREGRPSEVRLDRLVELTAEGVRREGAALDRRTFDEVISAARRFHAFARPVKPSRRVR